MEEKNQNDLTQKYSKGAIVIHWLTALLIFILFPLGKFMRGIEPVEKLDLIKVHALLGTVVFILTILRSWLFFKAPRPDDLKTGSKLNDRLAVWIHNAFYFILLGIAFSGIATMIAGGYGEAIISGNVERIINESATFPLKGHRFLTLVLVLLFVMHVIGVVKHYFIMKENALKRIF